MKPYLADSDFTLYNGDALEVLRTLPDESVHMCVTSPPFYGLRDYGTGTWEGGDAECDHRMPFSYKSSTLGASTGGRSEETHARSIGAQATPYDKTCGKCGATRIDRQIGLEETPEQWVQKLVEVFREVRRVLRKDGTLWLEVGDSYASSTANGGQFDFSSSGLKRDGRSEESRRRTLDHVAKERGRPQPNTRRELRDLKTKDLIGAPWLLAFALRADGWFLRSDIIWSRPNPMPESVTDRPTKSHSYVFLLTKSPRYYFDAEAVRERASENTHARYAMARETPKGREGHSGWDETTNGHVTARNIRSVWTIATQPYPEAHFATYPEELVRRCILAGTSERGCCPECGGPWVREVEDTLTPGGGGGPGGIGRDLVGHRDPMPRMTKTTATLGWHPSCECFGSEPRAAFNAISCTVLDPFSGSGTTALVARKHGRKCIGIELSADYCALAARRLQQLSLLSEVGS